MTGDLELLTRFDEAREATGRSVKTRHGEQKILIMFARWLGTGLLGATTENIGAWIVSWGEVSAATRTSRLSALRSLYTFAIGEGLLEVSPAGPFDYRPHGRLGGLSDVELSHEYRVAMERKGLATTTVYKMLCELRMLWAWATPRSVLDLDTTDIEAWLDSRKLSSNTRAHTIGFTSSFYRWALRAGLITGNPCELIERPSVRLGLPRPVTDADLVVALDAADPLMRCWLLLAAYEGLRCQEICGVRREHVMDVNDPPLLLVHKGKGRKERIVPLHGDVLAALEALPMRRSGLLFPDIGRVEREMPPWEMSQRINAHLAGAGVDGTAHRLRHWFGTRTYQASHDLRLVQSLLGHANPTTTAIYAAFSPGEAVGVVNGLQAKRIPSTNTTTKENPS